MELNLIRDGIPENADCLTQIAFAAKRFWNYPQEYYERWAKELTIVKDYIENNQVRCKIVSDEIVGFYSTVNLQSRIEFQSGYMESGLWLDHMFVLPEYQGRRIGTELFSDLVERSKSQGGAISFRIFVDPNATGFHDKMGAIQVRTSGSSIPNRTIPVYLYSK